MRDRIIALVLASAMFAAPFVIARAFAHATTHVRVSIPQRCLRAEDSAAHVYLWQYGGGVAVYHCRRAGY